MKRIAMAVSSFLVVALSVSAQTGVLTVSNYGAKCNGTGNDAPAFQAAANAAHSSYLSTNTAVTVTYAGNCVLLNSIGVQSGVHWLGYGEISVPSEPTSPPPGFPTNSLGVYPAFYALNADDVEWDHVAISMTAPKTDHPYASGISWLASNDSSSHSHLKVMNSVIFNFAWGVSVIYNDTGSSGSLTDVEIGNDTVSSQLVNPTTYNTWDGIHVGGSITDVRIHDNSVTNRGDAAIGLTSECCNANQKLLTPSDVTVENNSVLQDRIGIDISGARNVEVSGNFVQETANASGLPTIAFRQIYYNDYPVNVHTFENYFDTITGTNGFTVKIDPAVNVTPVTWPPLDSSFENNIIAGPPNPLYLRGDSIVVSGNTFIQTGGLLDVDQYEPNTVVLPTSNTLIGTNRWVGTCNIVVATVTNVKMASQATTAATPCPQPSNVDLIPN